MSKKSRLAKKRAREAAQGDPEHKKNNSNEKGVRKNWPEIIKENENFEKFYKLQNIVPEGEWDQFMAALRRSLPTAFRITGCRGQAQALVHIMKTKLVQDILLADKELKKENDGEENEEFTAAPLPWYPDNLGWQMSLTRKDIRNNEAHFRLHNFLISETDSGNLSRQEAVSMIPPLALRVQPHHKVLDMCAAPGSKTAQIIEALHSDDSVLKNPDGIIIANDMDNKRCYMLVHQAKRIQSPTLIITNHDGSQYPELFHTDTDGNKKPLRFDRILCDVPCSGDGTMRKNVDVWKKWNASNGLFLHQTQFGILKRGMELLEVGGQLVYSTCSLNPTENEAVISRMLRESQGAVELMDIDLPNLKHCPGLSHWFPCSRDLVSYTSVEDVPDEWKHMVRPYHFPPTAEEASRFNLQKCMRVLPHQQDTGGFFISLLKKVKALPWEESVKLEERRLLGAPEPTEARKNGRPPPKKARRIQGYKEDPFVFMSEDDPIWAPVREFYDLSGALDSTQFLTRSHVGKKKNIYFTTGLVRDIVTTNEGYVKIINTGVKTFARADNKWTPCDFRLAHEGLSCLLPYINGRRVEVPKEDLLILLLNNDESTPPKIDTLSAETQSAVLNVERGSFILEMNSPQGEDGLPAFKIEMIGWKGHTSLRAYVSLHERLHYLRMCGGDVSKFEKNKFKELDSNASGNGGLENNADDAEEFAGEPEDAETIDVDESILNDDDTMDGDAVNGLDEKAIEAIIADTA